MVSSSSDRREFEGDILLARKVVEGVLQAPTDLVLCPRLHIYQSISHLRESGEDVEVELQAYGVHSRYGNGCRGSDA